MKYVIADTLIFFVRLCFTHLNITLVISLGYLNLSLTLIEESLWHSGAQAGFLAIKGRNRIMTLKSLFTVLHLALA